MSYLRAVASAKVKIMFLNDEKEIETMVEENRCATKFTFCSSSLYFMTVFKDDGDGRLGGVLFGILSQLESI